MYNKNRELKRQNDYLRRKEYMCYGSSRTFGGLATYLILWDPTDIWDLFFYGLGSALMQRSFFSDNNGLEPSSVHGSIEEAQELAFKQHWSCSKTLYR